MDDILAKAEQYRLLARNKDNAHYAHAQQLTKAHARLGIPVVVATTVVSTSIFATLSESTTTGWKIATGLVSVGAAVLASLQTFFNFSDQAQRHLTSAVGYSKLRRRFEQFELEYSSEGASRSEALSGLADLTKTLDQLEEDAPTIRDKVYEKVRARFRAQPDELRRDTPGRDR